MAVENDPARLRRETEEMRDKIKEEAEKLLRKEYRHLKGKGKL